MAQPHDPADYTGYLFRRAQQAHVAAWQAHVSAEVTSVQFGVLNTLARHPGSSQADLCDALDLDRSTIADIVVRLERRGLIERVRDREDRRRNNLRLTSAGQDEFRRLVPKVRKVDDVLTGSLDPADRAELRRLLFLVLASQPAPDGA